MVSRMAARLIIASLCISACSSVGVGDPSRPPGNQARTDTSGGSTTGRGNSVNRTSGPAETTQKASAERTLDSIDGPSITAFIRDDASDDDTRDLAVSVGKMQGVESVDVSYGTDTIKVYLLSSATSDQKGRIRDYLSSSNIVTRVE
jgi:hypothetical protein